MTGEVHHLLGKEFFIPGSIPLRVLRRDPQPPYPLHNHDFMELVIITGGSGTHTGPQGDISISTGAVFVIKGDTAHGYQDLNDLCLINVLFDLASLSIPLSDLGTSPGFHSFFTVDPLTRFQDISNTMFTMNEQDIQTLCSKVYNLEQALESQQAGDRFLAISWFMQIIHFISRRYDEIHGTDSPAGSYRLGAALSYIETHLADKITIDQLTDAAGMSTSSLLRAFKSITGTSPIRYHQEKRMEKADWYLIHSDYTIGEISDLLGFNDSNYFTRQFKNLRQMSPRDFRNKIIH